MGCDNGYELYDIMPAIQQAEAVQRAVEPYCAEPLVTIDRTIERYRQRIAGLRAGAPSSNRLDTPKVLESWLAAEVAKRDTFIKAVQTGDLPTILCTIVGTLEFSDWGDVWWGKATEPPVCRRIVRISYGDNVSNDAEDLLHQLKRLKLIIELVREETWT